MDKRVSIVIPVYNVEEYLSKCLNSVLEQKYSNLEIICINDGSTDNSMEILKKYKESDNRIKVISRENRGLLATRIEGVQNATGDYVTFLDSDDWFDNDYIYTLIYADKQLDADIIRCNCKRVDDAGNEQFIKHFQNSTIIRENFLDDIYQKMCKNNSYNNAVRQLIKTEIAKKICSNVDTSIAMGEDLEFNINLYSEVNKVITVDYYGYNYRYNDYSISRSLKKERLIKNLNDEVKVYKHLVEFMKKHNNDYLKKIAYVRLLFQTNSHLARLIFCDDISKEEFEKITYLIGKSDELKEIRNNINLKDINLLFDKKGFLAKILYKEKYKLYIWIVKNLYTLVKK